MKNKKEILDTLEILNLIERDLRQPNSWCKFNWAINTSGDGVRPTDSAAVKWCLQGFINKHAHTQELFNITNRELNKELPKEARTTSLFVFNDKIAKNQSDVLYLVSKTIQSLTLKLLPWYNPRKWLPRRFR